jgi:hypothetical protein
MPSDYLLNRNMVKLGMAPQSVSWADGPLTFNEVAKFFAVPIADAAQKLGKARLNPNLVFFSKYHFDSNRNCLLLQLLMLDCFV